MWSFRQGSRLLPPLLRALRHPRAQITSKPPEHPLSTALSVYVPSSTDQRTRSIALEEQAIAFSVMTTCFLGPTAWVLAHLEHYKSRAE